MSRIYINNCPTRCNTKQSTYYSASSLYMFRVSTTPIIRSTKNCNYSLRHWSYFLCSYLPPTWPGGSCTVPEAVVTFLCTPDDGCGWHQKHVEWTCRVINWLFCVASRWTIINKKTQIFRNPQWHLILPKQLNTQTRYSTLQHYPFQVEAQTALFKDPVRTAL